MLSRLLAAAAFAAIATGAAAAEPVFAFASAEQGRAILGARDEYVRATAPLERAARLKSADAVDEERLARFMADSALEWTEAERRELRPLLEALEPFLAGVRGQRPAQILLIKADAALEDGAPHTRANAIVLPAHALESSGASPAFVLAHELFHVLTRADPELRERLYAAIGFERCASVRIPEALSRLRITNPDAVDSRHTIAVRYGGKAVHMLPYIRFASDQVDPRSGFLPQLHVDWLFVERQDGRCSVRAGPGGQAGIAPQALEGLDEKIGRNTQYVLHPEEILADNFAQLFLASRPAGAPSVPSPEVLERMRKILFD